MSDTLTDLRRRIKTTDDLRAVVKTMKAMSAASITPFEQAVDSLRDYFRTVELALSVCMTTTEMDVVELTQHDSALPSGFLVHGTDQGMVGQFNEYLVEDAVQRIKDTGTAPIIWAIGERVQLRLENEGLSVIQTFPTPSSVTAITPLVTELLLEMQSCREREEVGPIFQLHNRPIIRGTYEPQLTSLLPLDAQWRQRIASVPWPTKFLPEMIAGDPNDLASMIREYLFTSVFQACAESCAAENAARLAAMQLAEKNIDDRRHILDLDHNRQRQTTIDEELFDLVSGFESLKAPN